jgi:hypothetical protein
MAFTGTALNAYTKRTYDPKFIENSMTSLEEKILRVIKKETDGSGEQYSYLADADDSFNGSADFPTAQNAAANNANTVGSKFLLDWNDYSAVAQITSSIIGKTRNNDGAWQKAVDVAMRKTMKSIAHANAVFLQGYGWGEIGKIQSVSGSTFVPNPVSDIFKYVKGMPLHFSASLHANALRTATVIYVTGVNYTSGSELVTCSAAVAPGANGDYAFIAGCRQDSGSPARIALPGLGVYLPDQKSGRDLPDTTISQFGGPDRSTNSRLYGTYQDATAGGNILEALIDAVQTSITIGNAKKMECFGSKGTYTQVVKDLQNAVRYDGNPTSKTVGTNRLLILADGDVEAHLQVSRTTNDNMIWGFDPGTIIMKSIGGAPHIDMEDGLTMARQSASAGYEVRWFQQATLELSNPASALRVQLV